MASDEEKSIVIFKGSDSKECDEFISAVMRHALDQGKLREDEWIADFAAPRMAQSALLWWSGLNEDTQKSWKKIRQAMIFRYQPKFYGKSGEEAEEFIHQVRQRAQDAGKQGDNDWIISSISNCFVGKALRWYLSLEQNVQEDWRLLQVAMLIQYQREGEPCNDVVLKMPTPTPAAPPKVRRGRLQAHDASAGTWYLSRTLHRDGLLLTQAAHEALVVEYDTSISPQAFLIPDGQIPNFDTLGARWNSTDTRTTSGFACACAFNIKNGTVSLDSTNKGPQMKDGWNVQSTPNSSSKLLQVTMTYGTDILVARTQAEGPENLWFRTRPTLSDAGLDLFLELI